MDDPDAEVVVWSCTHRFVSWEDAGNAYEACRDIVFATEMDGSAYRILVNDQGHVVVVAFGLPEPSLVHRLTDACSKGESVIIPDEVIFTLALRHEEMRVPGSNIEHRSGL
ncbi:MAG: hypothetical protein WEC75_09605 [Dehalococcoidia bacterium]